MSCEVVNAALRSHLTDVCRALADLVAFRVRRQHAKMRLLFSPHRVSRVKIRALNCIARWPLSV